MSDLSMEPKHPIARFAPYLIASAAGLFTTVLDLHATEVQWTVALILLFTSLLALARPVHPWRWALLVAGGIPAAFAFGVRGTVGPGDPSPTHVGMLLPFIPALIGAYVGAWLGRFSREGTPGPPTS